MNNYRYCFTLDLKDDAKLIAEYEKYHEQIWPEITQAIKSAGIIDLEIYRFNTRLFMIMEVDSEFTFEKNQQIQAANPKVQEWEDLMWKYQAALPGSKPGEKWILMQQIFALKKQKS